MLKNKKDGRVERSLELALGVPRYFRRWGQSHQLWNGEKVPQKVRDHSGVS